MAYRELINVATGVKGQLDNCITALDLHENAPDEIEQIADLLSQAQHLCDQVISAGESEPEEQPVAAEE